MSSCCQTTNNFFDDRHAQRDLRRYNSKGPGKTTKVILSHVGNSGLTLESHLDIGSGIGVISLELLKTVIRSATLVDISSAYLETARSRAQSRGFSEQVKFIQGDAVEEAYQLGEADLVTLDRVLCCYPNFERLVEVSTAKARKSYIASYPRNLWYVRLAIRFDNWRRKRKGVPFRAFVHRPHHIDAMVASAGFERVDLKRTLFWEIAFYRRR